MMKDKRLICALLGTAGLAVLISLFWNRNVQSQRGPSGTRVGNQQGSKPTQKERDDAATPIVDFEDVSGTGRSEGDRHLKNTRHDKASFVLSQPHQHAGEVIRESHWQADLSDLPADKSDLIIEGEVTGAQAFLSDDKTGIYSEFTIRTSKILKAPAHLSVSAGDTVVAERSGGKVKYPSGKVIRYRIEGQGMPALGERYLFFLARTAEGNYRLLTAYEIRGDKVFALDGSRINFRGQGDWVFDKHNGKDLHIFHEDVERAINSSRKDGGR